MRFRTTILRSGKTATGIEIPTDVLAALNAGKKPPVTVTVNGYKYRSTVATINGRPMVGLNTEHRVASGLSGRDEVTVDIEVDTAPRDVELPPDFKAALDAEPAASATFERLSNSLKRYHVDQINGAKSDETRQRRIERSVAILAAGKQR